MEYDWLCVLSKYVCLAQHSVRYTKLKILAIMTLWNMIGRLFRRNLSVLLCSWYNTSN
uniref:Uncharacterized protein n=1 Tax=Lepeophtheirus salmonis TaxID=72036 RepID=A0A0K2VEC7_LEPSM